MVNLALTAQAIPLVLVGLFVVYLPYTRGQYECYKLRLDHSSYVCDPTFPACSDGSSDTIQITNAIVTVTSDITDPPERFPTNFITVTVDATEAANSIIHCDTFTCQSLAYILLANYSTQYCFGSSNRDRTSDGYIYINAEVYVEYTEETVNTATFSASVKGNFAPIYTPQDLYCPTFSAQDDATIPSAQPNSTITNFNCTADSASTLGPTIGVNSDTPSSTSPTTTSRPTMTSQTAPSSMIPVTTSQLASTPDITSPLPSTAATSLTQETTETDTALLSTHGITTPAPSAPNSTPDTPTALPSTDGITTPAPSVPNSTPETPTALPSTHGSTTPAPSVPETTVEATTVPSSTHGSTTPAPSVPETTPEATTVPSSTHDITMPTPSVPETTSETTTIPPSTNGITTPTSSTPETSPRTTTVLSSTHDANLDSVFIPKTTTTIFEDFHILFNPKLLEEKVFHIGMNLSRNQSITVNNTYIYRSTVDDLCATERIITLNGNHFSLPQKYFCDQSRDGSNRYPDIIVGITTSTRLAELYNDKTLNATYGGDGSNLRVVSDVITPNIFIGDEILSIPFNFTLQHYTAIDERFDSPTCSSWNNDNRNWNSAGCKEIATNDLNTTSCYCDHMTSFAILVSLVPNELEGDIISGILTWIGLGLSIASLVISLFIFIILRRSLTADRVIIHANFMFAILFADITFFSGINPIEIESLCKAYAFLLNYFFLAMVFWMLVEGVHLYRQIIQVFDTGNPRIWVYGIIGWGFPIVILVITGIVKHQSYGYGASCWLNPTDGTIWAFNGPAIGIALINVVILLLVVKAVVSASRGQLDNDKIKQIKAGLRSTMLLLPLLGITWLLTPLVAAFSHVKALEYIFILLNTLQVQNAIGEIIRKARDSNALNTNASTKSTNDGSTVKPGVRNIRVAPAPGSSTQN